MTVKELREVLSELPDDLPVMVKGYEWGWQELSPPRKANVMLNFHSPGSYGGPHEEADEDGIAYYQQFAKDTGDPPLTVIDALLLPRGSG